MISDNNVIRELQRENKMLMQQNDLENALNDVFRKEIARLKDENSKLKAEIEKYKGDNNG